MALTIFAEIDRTGDQLFKGDHIFAGTKREMGDMAKLVDAIYQSNKRARSVKMLSERFAAAALIPEPVIRLTNKEARQLAESLGSYVEAGGKLHKAKATADWFNTALCIYGS